MKSLIHNQIQKTLMTLSSQTKTGNVTAIRATLSQLFQKEVSSPLSDARAWVKAAFMKAKPS